MLVCRVTGEDFPPKDKIVEGLAPNYYYLSKELKKLGVRSVLITGGYPTYKAYEKIEDGIEVYRVRTYPKIIKAFSAPLFNWQVYKKIKSLPEKPDVINVHNFFGVWLEKFKRKLGIPIVMTAHGTDIGWRKNVEHLPLKYGWRSLLGRFELEFTHLLFKSSCKNADKIITVSKKVKEEIVNGFKEPASKIFPVYNGLDHALFKRKNVERLAKKYGVDFVLLYVGAVHMRKGLSYLIKSAKILKEKHKFKLLFIGGGKEAYIKYIRDLIKKNDVEDVIELIGSIPYTKLPNYYSGADLLVFPSITESFGKIFVEAMACGCPIVATKAGGIPEVIGDAGLLVPPKDSAALAKAISKILEDDKLRKEFMIKGYAQSK